MEADTINATDLFDKAVYQHRNGRLADAVKLYETVLKHQPNNIGALINLGALLRQIKKYSAAKLLYEYAMSINPQDATIYSNYGNLLVDMLLFDEAAIAHKNALDLMPANNEFIYNAGVVPFLSNRPDDAIKYFDKVLTNNPDHYFARWNSALAYLQKGDYIEGFLGYELRHKHEESRKKSLTIPLWDGTRQPEKTLLLTTEQGFGDVIQFARFIPLIKSYFKTVIIEVRPELIRLIESIDGIDKVISRNSDIPPHDYQYPLLSLPYQFKISLESLPNTVPYIRVKLIGNRVDRNKLNIGLIWASKLKPTDRSCPLEKFFPLMSSPGVKFYSFQIGERQQDIPKLGCGALITDVSGYINDFYDTAQWLKQMDLVITIDTSVAHLSGALGIPTWTLLLHAADWRWLLDRKDSPWYPGMTLYRQTRHNSWDECLDYVRKDFVKWINEPSARKSLMSNTN